jgi:hypothetical protein
MLPLWVPGEETLIGAYGLDYPSFWGACRATDESPAGTLDAICTGLLISGPCAGE